MNQFLGDNVILYDVTPTLILQVYAYSMYYIVKYVTSLVTVNYFSSQKHY